MKNCLLYRFACIYLIASVVAFLSFFAEMDVFDVRKSDERSGNVKFSSINIDNGKLNEIHNGTALEVSINSR